MKYLEHIWDKLSTIQQAAIDYALRTRRCAVSLLPGSGKTLVGIAAQHYSSSLLREKYGGNLLTIIVCKKNAVYQWSKEFTTWGFTTPHVIIDPATKPATRLAMYSSLISVGTIIVTYSTILKDFQQGLFPVLKFVDQQKRFKVMLIMDEIHVNKSSTTLHYQMFSYLAKFASIVVGLY